MGRKSTVANYIGKQVNGITILEPTEVRGGRLFVKCLCPKCQKEFEVQFHNVYKGGYKSCGCAQRGFKENSGRWKGEGEISLSYFHSLKRGAELRNLCFDITIEQIWELFLKQERKCALSGANIGFADSKVLANKTASLDRKDPKIGYVLSNVQWVHVEINYMKQSLDDSGFLEWVKRIYLYNKNEK